MSNWLPTRFFEVTSKQICGKHEVDSGRRGGLNMIERLWWFPKIHVYDKKLYSNPVDRLARWSGRAASTIAAHHSQYARYYTDFLLKNFVFHLSQFSLAGVEPAQPEFGICQVWISKCRRKSDLGLRMTSVLGERMQLQCRLPTNSAAKPVFEFKVRTVRPRSLCKYRDHAQT